MYLNMNKQKREGLMKKLLMFVVISLLLTGCGEDKTTIPLVVDGMIPQDDIVDEVPDPDATYSEGVSGKDYIFFRFGDGISDVGSSLTVYGDLGFDMKDMSFYKVNVDGTIVTGGIEPLNELRVKKVNNHEKVSLKEVMNTLGIQSVSFDSAPAYDPMFYEKDDGSIYAAFKHGEFYVTSDEVLVGTYYTWQDAVDAMNVDVIVPVELDISTTDYLQTEDELHSYGTSHRYLQTEDGVALYDVVYHYGSGEEHRFRVIIESVTKTGMQINCSEDMDIQVNDGQFVKQNSVFMEYGDTAKIRYSNPPDGKRITEIGIAKREEL